MKKLGIIIIVIILAGCMFAACKQPEYNILGTVTDADGMALEYANVTYEGKTVAVTDSYGRFYLKEKVKDAEKYASKIGLDNANIASYSVDYAVSSDSLNIEIMIKVELINKDFDVNGPLRYVDDEKDANFGIYGKILDLNYKPVSNVDIYFGETPEKAAKSGDGGSFSFYGYKPGTMEGAKICDYIFLPNLGKQYSVKYKAQSSTYESLECLIFIETEGSTVNLYGRLMESFGFECRFHQDGIFLPNGYNSRDIIHKAGDVSSNGDTVIVGVKAYVGDILVAVSNKYTMEFRDILPGTVVHFEFSGFYFRLRAQGMPILENDNYMFTGIEDTARIEIRGATDNPRILID